MAKTSTLYNDFSANFSPFSTNTGSPSVSGGNLVLPAGASIKTTTTDWDLTSSSLVIELATTSEADELYFTIGTAAILAPSLRWNAGKWNAGISVFAFPGTAASWGNYVTSTNTGRKYARLSQSGGTTTYEESVDGVTWSTITTNTNPGSVTAGNISLYNSNGTTTINVATLGVSAGGGSSIAAISVGYHINGTSR